MTALAAVTGFALYQHLALPRCFCYHCRVRRIHVLSRTLPRSGFAGVASLHPASEVVFLGSVCPKKSLGSDPCSDGSAALGNRIQVTSFLGDDRTTRRAPF